MLHGWFKNVLRMLQGCLADVEQQGVFIRDSVMSVQSNSLNYIMNARSCRVFPCTGLPPAFDVLQSEGGGRP